MKGLASLAVVALPLVAASPVIIDTIHNDAAPVLSSSNSKVIPDSYIVVFKKHVTHETAAAHHTWVQDVHLESMKKLKKRSQFPMTDSIFEGLKHTWNIAGGLLGYSGHFGEDVLEILRRSPDVSQMIYQHV